jgi:hypothetical protein
MLEVEAGPRDVDAAAQGAPGAIHHQHGQSLVDGVQPVVAAERPQDGGVRRGDRAASYAAQVLCGTRMEPTDTRNVR